MVRSVERALDILELVAKTGKPVPLPAIAKTLGLPRTTAFSIVRTLSKRGMLEIVAEEGYRLGALSGELARLGCRTPDLTVVARPLLEQIARELNETAFLAVPDHDQIVFIDKVESSQSIRYSARIGTRRPLYCTSHGKLTLAFRSDAEIDRYLANVPLVPITSKTITDPASIRRELQKIRRQGYSVSDGEYAIEAFGISVPLTDEAGSLLGMVSAVGPTGRMKPRLRERAAFLLDLVRRVPMVISA